MEFRLRRYGAPKLRARNCFQRVDKEEDFVNREDFETEEECGKDYSEKESESELEQATS